MKKKESGSEAKPDGRLTQGWVLLGSGIRENGEWGTFGLPILETRIGALSSACGRRARFANAQALLAISDFRHAVHPAQRVRDFNPKPAWGYHPQTPSSLRSGLKKG